MFALLLCALPTPSNVLLIICMGNEVIGQYTHAEMGMCMRSVSGYMGYVLKT